MRARRSRRPANGSANRRDRRDGFAHSPRPRRCTRAAFPPRSRRQGSQRPRVPRRHARAAAGLRLAAEHALQQQRQLRLSGRRRRRGRRRLPRRLAAFGRQARSGAGGRLALGAWRIRQRRVRRVRPEHHPGGASSSAWKRPWRAPPRSTAPTPSPASSTSSRRTRKGSRRAPIVAAIGMAARQAILNWRSAANAGRRSLRCTPASWSSGASARTPRNEPAGPSPAPAFDTAARSRRKGG